MTRSIFLSLVFHSVMIVLTALSLPFMKRAPIDLPPIISVELIQISEKTNIPYATKAREILEKIWKDWEAFASYAFNKSHSTCYALIAYQTAYLKSHYPAEYMAAVLSNNMNDIKQVSFFMEECKRMSISVRSRC